MATILLVEDEASMRLLTCAKLKHQFTIICAKDGVEALELLERQPVDLIIADVMMPRMDGYTLVQTLRDQGNGIPVLLLTAKQSFEDKRRGFSSGVDDYMTKPFDTSELLARVRALTRRQGEVVSEELAFGDLSLHLSSHCLRRGDKSVRLGFKEFEVLRLLLQNAKLVTPKDDIIAKVWGLDSEAEDNNVEVYISFLRKKLSFLASQVSIGTVRKVGYFLTTSDEPGSFGGGGMP